VLLLKQCCWEAGLSGGGGWQVAGGRWQEPVPAVQHAGATTIQRGAALASTAVCNAPSTPSSSAEHSAALLSRGVSVQVASPRRPPPKPPKRERQQDRSRGRQSSSIDDFVVVSDGDDLSPTARRCCWNDHDTVERAQVVSKLLLESYKVLMGTFLSWFVPHRCDVSASGGDSNDGSGGDMLEDGTVFTCAGGCVCIDDDGSASPWCHHYMHADWHCPRASTYCVAQH
jgi:hypothetical protein